MEIPGLGTVTKENDDDFHGSHPISVPVLGGKLCRIIVEGYVDDPNKGDFHVAIANFLSIGPSVLRDVDSEVFRYYKDANDGCWNPGDDEYIVIGSPTDVWDHVRFGDEPVVKRRYYRDKAVYISLECNCDWEPEHGLQIVFKNGLRVNKIGGYDGHLTNSDTYGDESLEDVIYA